MSRHRVSGLLIRGLIYLSSRRDFMVRVPRTNGCTGHAARAPSGERGAEFQSLEMRQSKGAPRDCGEFIPVKAQLACGRRTRAASAGGITRRRGAARSQDAAKPSAVFDHCPRCVPRLHRPTSRVVQRYRRATRRFFSFRTLCNPATLFRVARMLGPLASRPVCRPGSCRGDLPQAGGCRAFSECANGGQRLDLRRSRSNVSGFPLIDALTGHTNEPAVVLRRQA